MSQIKRSAKIPAQITLYFITNDDLFHDTSSLIKTVKNTRKVTIYIITSTKTVHVSIFVQRDNDKRNSGDTTKHENQTNNTELGAIP